MPHPQRTYTVKTKRVCAACNRPAAICTSSVDVVSSLFFIIKEPRIPLPLALGQSFSRHPYLGFSPEHFTPAVGLAAVVCCAPESVSPCNKTRAFVCPAKLQLPSSHAPHTLHCTACHFELAIEVKPTAHLMRSNAAPRLYLSSWLLQLVPPPPLDGPSTPSPRHCRTFSSNSLLCGHLP